MGIVSYAQNFEDVILWRALGHIERGTYIDVGAHDPIVDSVSKAFYERGWRGVHIEPTAFYANLLRADRPDEVVVQGAIAAEPGLLTFFEIPATGLSTALAEVAEHHRKSGRNVRETAVAALTLDEVLRRTPNEANWLKIDVEGFEKEVLAGWRDLDYRPWIVVVESTFPGSQRETHEAWESLILGKGYEFVYFDGLNRFYVSDAHPELHGAFRFGPNIFDGFQLSEVSAFLHTIKHRFDESLESVAEQKLSVEKQLNELRVAHASAVREWENRERSIDEEAARVHKVAKEKMQSEVQLLTERVVTLADELAREARVNQKATVEANNARAEIVRTFQARLAEKDEECAERLERWRREADIKIQTEANRCAEQEKQLRGDISALQEAHARLAREFADRERELVAEAARGQAVAQAEVEKLLREIARRECSFSEQFARAQQDRQAALDVQQRTFFEREAVLGSELAGAREALTRSTAEAAERERTAREEARKDAMIARAEADAQLSRTIERHRNDMERFERVQREAQAAIFQQLRAAQEREDLVRGEKARLEVEFRAGLQAQSEERQALQSQIEKRDRAIEVAQSMEATLRGQLVTQARKVCDLRTRLASMQRTFSWRVTAPLRKLANWAPRNRLQAAEDASGKTHAEREEPIPYPWPKSTGNLAAPASPIAQNAAATLPLVASEPSVPPGFIAEDTEFQMTAIRNVDELLTLCDVDFVSAAYSGVLHRPPDPEGLQYYVSRLRTGEAKGALLAQIATSSEARSRGTDLSGLDEFLREYRKTRRWFWGRRVRDNQRRMIIHRIENSLGRLEERIRAQESESVRRLVRLEAVITGLSAMQKDSSTPETSVASSTASPSEAINPGIRNLGRHGQYVLGHLVMQAPVQEGVV